MIQDYLEEAASRFPSRPAIIVGDRQYDFSCIRRRAISIARYYRDAGLRIGDRVLLAWDNGGEYAALYFGILMAGGVVVPLNPTNTRESLEYIAGHCGGRHAAANERALRHFAEWWKGSPIVSDALDVPGTFQLSEVLSGNVDAVPPDGRGLRDDVGLILYTSGTTGCPKGVMLSHRNIEANTESILGYLPLGTEDRTLAILPFYYSYGNSLLMTHVRAGGALVVENGFAFVKQALTTMREQRVTGFSGVPSHYSILLHRSKFLESKWPDLRYLTCAGGGLPPLHVRMIREALPDVKIYLMYGQTEGAARLSSLDPALVDVKVGSVGMGIPGVDLRVVDNEGKDVHSGNIGEVLARGENIMQGYLGDEAATREVIRNGWLHTGDLATVDEEGYVYIKGREREFIKSGGYRISPQQVEEALLDHPAIHECAVVGASDQILGEAIVAFVVYGAYEGGSDPSESIIAFARGRIPHYMLPQRIIPIDRLPKTESGKIRRVLLKEEAALRLA